ncbi:MAG: EF-Tu/IF-2/RF-3 family GTPase, partial [Dongiaceae bacterium]
VTVEGLDDPALDRLLPADAAATLREQVAMARGLMPPFDLADYRAGHLTPVLFGSALRNFGVRDLIDLLAERAPPPESRKADKRLVSPADPAMTGFVFKIQANMDPNHRDRIAFLRICSGRLRRGMKAKLVRTGKTISLHTPQFFFARDRAIADEAFAGDIVGIPNHGTLRIGDTLTEGEALSFPGVPSFAPEIIRRVRVPDAMRAKKLREALKQMAEEGVVQVFLPFDGSPALVGVVGALQLDVLKQRLAAEYNLPIDFEAARFTICRWVSATNAAELETFTTRHRGDIAADLDGALVFMASSEFTLNYEIERAPKIAFSDVKDYQRHDAVAA